MATRSEVWASAEAYEGYVGRWSRLAAAAFLDWLALPRAAAWLDVGCGTGALAQTIAVRTSPRRLVAIDASVPYVSHARARIHHAAGAFVAGDARQLPFRDRTFDGAVSGLVLNFVPEPGLAAREMRRVVRPGGAVAAYVWDYAGDMQLMRRFWDAAGDLDPAARDLDEGTRFPLCAPEPLAAAFAGLVDVDVTGIAVPTVFRDFDDYWTPFLGGQGPAPSYVMSLDDERRTALRESLRGRLPAGADKLDGRNLDLALGSAYIWTRPNRWFPTKWTNWLRLVLEVAGPGQWPPIQRDLRYLSRALRVEEIADLSGLDLDGFASAPARVSGLEATNGASGGPVVMPLAEAAVRLPDVVRDRLGSVVPGNDPFAARNEARQLPRRIDNLLLKSLYSRLIGTTAANSCARADS